MKTAIPSTAKDAQNPASSSRTPLPSPHSGHLAQLAAMMNQSPRVQAQLSRAGEIQNSEPVQRQMALGAEINQQQGRVKPAIQMEKGAAVNDDAGLVRASQSQRIVQRMKEKVGDQWVEKEIKFGELTPEQVKDIRDNMYNAAFMPNGKYKLSAAEIRDLNRRASDLENSPEALRMKEEKEQKDDSAALGRLQRSFADAKKWAFDGAPTHMGESDRGFQQNWEIAFTIDGQRGVLHLHFDTNEKAAISAATLGRAHIKTRLTSKAGNFEAPAGMVEEAIKVIPKS